jgi:hypothetical protein
MHSAGKLNGYVDQIAGVLTMDSGSRGGQSSSYLHRKVAAMEDLATTLSSAVEGFEIPLGGGGGGGGMMKYF